MLFYNRLKHNVMVFLLLGYCFSGGCYSILRLIICSKSVKNAIDGASVLFYSYSQCSSASCFLGLIVNSD